LPEPNGRMRIISAISEELSQQIGRSPSLEFFEEMCNKEFPHFGCKLSEPHWLTVFNIHERLAGQYRKGRVFLAGDAAHTHSPAGGQGMNTGLQDAMNLIWKLALVIKGVGQTSLLDSYGEERRPVADALVRNSGLQTRAIAMTNPIVKGIRSAVVSTLPHLKMIHQRIAQAAGMLTISYSNSSIVQSVSPGGWGWIGSQNVVSGGMRLPPLALTRVNGGDDPVRMSTIANGTEHHLFVFVTPGYESLIDESQKAMARYRNWVKVHVVLAEGCDPIQGAFKDNDAIAVQFGISESGFVLVRPDHYLGFLSAPADVTLLTNYLAVNIFI